MELSKKSDSIESLENKLKTTKSKEVKKAIKLKLKMIKGDNTVLK